MTDSRIYQPYPNLLQPIAPVAPSPAAKTSSVPKVSPNSSNNSFAQVLEKEQKAIKFSQHSLARLQTRGIKLDDKQLNKLEQAVDKAEKKGAKESLVLVNSDLALVVSVKNRTVITAMDGASMKDNVFTNIDSAVII